MSSPMDSTLKSPHESPFYQSPKRPKHAPYPFAEWFASIPDPGDFIELQQGRDFTPTVQNFRRHLARIAREQEVLVSARIVGTTLRVTRVKSRITQHGHGYPWDLWLDGQAHRLLPQLDFYKGPAEMASHAVAAARSRGLKVRTSTKHTPGALWVQAYSPDPDQPAAEESPLDALVLGHDESLA